MDIQTFFRRNGRIHLIGCAGAGTQPLALILHEKGIECSGSDLLESETTRQLQKAGIRVFKGHNAKNLPPEDGRPLMVVHTSAASDANPELTEAKRRNVPCLKRGEALALLAELFPIRIAVSGSHGKTSVTAMIAHVLKMLGKNPGFLVGGNVRTWEKSGTAGDGKILVTEVDESDSTNALFHATLGIVTNMEDDHAWSVGGSEKLFDSFRSFARNAEKILYVSGTHTDEVLKKFSDKSTVLPPGFPAKNERYPADWGGFFRMNARTAATALKIQFPEFGEKEIQDALFTYPGVERRMCERYSDGKVRVVEDYAHHPTELRASLEAFRETNPDRRLVVVFQPHRFARLKRYLNNFAEILSAADRVFIPPVFAAWTDLSDVDSDTLAERTGPKASVLSGTWSAMAETVAREIHTGDLVAVIGAGDVKEIIAPLSEFLARKK